MASLNEEDALSMWHFYQTLLAFRKGHDFKEKEYSSLTLDGETLSYQRGEFLFLLHFGETEVTYPLQGKLELIFGDAEMLEAGVKMGAYAGIALRVED